MSERPILFSAPMIRALLAGTKTQTRRIVKPQPPVGVRSAGVIYSSSDSNGEWSWLDSADLLDASIVGDDFRCPFGVAGDRLWVREAFIHEPADYCWEASVSIPSRPAVTTYRADFEGDTRGAGWKPSIHMPRHLSRITLEITGVRVERLQDISEEDAIAEGVSNDPGLLGNDDMAVYHAMRAADQSAGKIGAMPAPIARYVVLWESINGPGSWAANQWVWVVEFRRVES